MSRRSWFRPQDEREHQRGNAGHDVPDYCAHCDRPFMDHVNGRCPDEEDEAD